MAELRINPDTVCYVVVKARELDVKVDPEELEDLLALTWLGRGDGTIDDWDDILAEIQDVREQHTVEYLLGTPLLADYLEAGLAEFGQSCTGFELGHM